VGTVVVFLFAGCAAGSVGGGPPPPDGYDAGPRRIVGSDAGVSVMPPDAGPAREIDSFGPSSEVVASAGETSFSFEIAPGTIGFQLGGVDMYLDRLTAPDGASFYSSGVPIGWTTDGPPNFPQMPMNEATTIAIAPGRWSAALYYPSSSAVTLVSQRTADGALHGGVLDAYFYVPAGGVRDDERGVTVTAATFLDDYGAGISDFYALLGALTGLERGEVEVVEVDASFARVADDASETRGFGASRADRGPGLHALITAGGYERGWSGIAPGAPGVQLAGDPNSTVMIDVRAHPYFGFVVMHELGHVAGLWHPSEVIDEGGSLQYFHDPLGDTAQCTRTTVYEGARYLDCTEESNLMASYGQATPTSLSPAQVAIFVRSSIYRPYAPAHRRARPRLPDVARPPLHLGCAHSQR
jgi:hypothetical protein